MPKLRDIITQLNRELPRNTDSFHDEFSVESVARNGNDYTIRFGEDHSLVAGDEVNLSGFLAHNNFTEIVQSNGILTFTTEQQHDLTQGFHTQVLINGVTGLDDGRYNIESVTAQNKFTIRSILNPSTSGRLLESRVDALDGVYTISSVVDARTIVVSDQNARFNTYDTAQGSKVTTRPRIIGLTSEDRIGAHVTNLSPNKNWLFVVVDDSTADYDRDVSSDATQRRERSDQLQYNLNQDFHLYVVSDAVDPEDVTTLNEVEIRDSMIDLRVAICKAIVGHKFPTYFTDSERFITHFTGDGAFDYPIAFYVHRFSFQTSMRFTQQDAVRLSRSRAFREFRVDFKLRQDGYEQTKKTVEGDLPQ